MPRKPRLDIYEIVDVFEEWETWISSLLGTDDLFDARDSEGRFTHPVIEQMQISCFIPSAKLLCPDKISKRSFEAFVSRFGCCTTREASLCRLSTKLRWLSTAVRDTFWKLVDGKPVPHLGQLVVFCDFNTTYKITKWFMVYCGIDFAEAHNIHEYNRGDCHLALLSSRNVKKVRGLDAICMDVVPTPVLYKIIDAVSKAHLKVLVLAMTQDKNMSLRYYDKKPNRGGAIDCRWKPQTYTDTAIEEKASKSRQKVKDKRFKNRKPVTGWNDLLPMFIW